MFHISPVLSFDSSFGLDNVSIACSPVANTSICHTISIKYAILVALFQFKLGTIFEILPSSLISCS